MISVSHKGDFSKTYEFLKDHGKMKRRILERYGEQGVTALRNNTPVDSGITASSWYYTIKEGRGTITLSFNNSNIQNGVPIAIILQYGHATRNGGWVQGRDYINPAIQPIFDKLADEAWREVSR